MKIVELNSQLSLLTCKLTKFSRHLSKHPEKDQDIDHLAFKDLKSLQNFSKFAEGILIKIGFIEQPKHTQGELKEIKSCLLNRIEALERKLQKSNEIQVKLATKQLLNQSCQNAFQKQRQEKFEKQMSSLSQNLEDFTKMYESIQSTITKQSLKDLKMALLSKNKSLIDKHSQTLRPNEIHNSLNDDAKNHLLIPPEVQLTLKSNQQCRKFEDILNRVFVCPDEVQIRSFEIQSFDPSVNQNKLILDKSSYFVISQEGGIQSIERNIPSGKLSSFPF